MSLSVEPDASRGARPARRGLVGVILLRETSFVSKSHICNVIPTFYPMPHVRRSWFTGDADTLRVLPCGDAKPLSFKAGEVGHESDQLNPVQGDRESQTPFNLAGVGSCCLVTGSTGVATPASR